jgi:hypothetical protein
MHQYPPQSSGSRASVSLSTIFCKIYSSHCSLQVNSSTGPDRSHATERLMRAANRKTPFYDVVNNTTEVVKQRIGLSINSKLLPGISRLQRFGDDHTEVAVNNLASPLQPPIQLPEHSALHSSASTSNQPDKAPLIAEGTLLQTEVQDPPNLQLHQIPQPMSLHSAPSMDGQDPPPNPQVHQIPEPANNTIALPPHPPSHQTPQFTNNGNAPPMDGQDLPLNPQVQPEPANNQIAPPPHPPPPASDTPIHKWQHRATYG